MLIERNGVLGVECDGRFIPAISGGFGFTISATTAMLITIAISIATTAATMAAQAQQAAQQQKYQNAQQAARDQQIAQNYALSIEAYNRETTQLQAKQRQADEGAVQKDQESSLASARAQATARVGAGEAGVAGASVDALLGDFMGQEARYRESVYSNLENQRQQTNAEIQGSQAKAEGRAQSIPSYIQAPIKQPDYMGAALQIGSSAFGAYNKYKSPETINASPIQEYRPGYD